MNAALTAIIMLAALANGTVAEAAFWPKAVHVSRYGIGCTSYEYQDAVGPPSYGVDDIGKEDVPALTGQQLAMVRRIQHYVHSKNLRFAFIPYARATDGFVVFDAFPGPWQGPCINAAPGYNSESKDREWLSAR